MLRDNRTARRFELEIDGQIVYADYRLDGATLTIPYVEAPPALRGTGAAGKLMQALAEKARAEHWTIIPLCGYAASWLQRHKEHHDLLA